MDEILSLYRELHDSLGINEICQDFCSRIICAIQDAVNKIPPDARVGIRCADPCAEYLIEAVDFSKTNVVGVFDLVRTGSFCGYPILPASELPGAACDYVIFATYFFREEIRRELGTFKGTVLDVYAVLEEHGISLRGPFNFYQHGLPLVLNFFYLNYLEAQGSAQKECSLRELLQAAIEYKDFSMISKLYKDNGGADAPYPILIETWERSQTLLEKIRMKVAARKQKDILAFWTDAVSYFDLKDMPRLIDKTNDGLFFANTITPAPWTRPVLKAIFQKLFPIDGFPETQSELNGENSALIQFLESRGYEFRWASFPVWAMDAQYRVPEVKKYMSSSLIWWYGLRSLLLSDKPCFYIFHFIAESHEPMFSPDLEKVHYFRPVTFTKSPRAMEQRKASLDYLDRCLMLYSWVFGEKIQIFFSDHGPYWMDIPSWAEERLHTYCLVLGDSVPKQRVQKFYSHINFEKLLHWLLEPETYKMEEALLEEALSQDVDYYDETLVNAAKGLFKKGYPKNGIAFRCIRTETCKYVLNALGEEYYYVINEDGTEILTPLEDDALRAELRSKCGTYFIDIRKYDKFKWTRSLYTSIRQDHPELGNPLWLIEES